METWEQFRVVIRKWARFEITDDQFYTYLVVTIFAYDADRRLADIFIAQHDGGEWSHSIYHRNVH
jgi:hypothetical protein